MGRPPTVPDEDIITVFRESEDPVLTASEVADHISLSRRGTYDRLRNLENDGVLQSKKVGGRTTVWWYPGHTTTPEN